MIIWLKQNNYNKGFVRDLLRFSTIHVHGALIGDWWKTFWRRSQFGGQTMIIWHQSQFGSQNAHMLDKTNILLADAVSLLRSIHYKIFSDMDKNKITNAGNNG